MVLKERVSIESVFALSPILEMDDEPIEGRIEDHDISPLEDCFAIYAQHEPVSYFLAQSQVQGGFFPDFDGRCHYLGSNNYHYFEPSPPYHYCEGDPIQIGDDPEFLAHSIETIDFVHDPIQFDPTIYDEEEVAVLSKCLAYYRDRSLKAFVAESIWMGEEALRRATGYISHGCTLEYDPDLNLLTPSPPEDFAPCLNSYPVDGKVDKGDIIASVNQNAQFLFASGRLKEAFDLIKPELLRWEMEFYLATIEDAALRANLGGHLEPLIAMIETEPGNLKAICSSMYHAYGMNSVSFDGDPPKLLSLLYRTALEIDGCDFDD